MKQSSPATFYGAPSDGLAMFWRDDRLECKDSLTFHYRYICFLLIARQVGLNMFVSICDCFSVWRPSQCPDCSKYLDVPSNQSALIAHLVFRHQAEAVNGASLGILVATTHLKAKNSEENDKIRHGQALGEEFQNAAFLVLRAPPLGDDPWRAIQERLPV